MEMCLQYINNNLYRKLNKMKLDWYNLSVEHSFKIFKKSRQN